MITIKNMSMCIDNKDDDTSTSSYHHLHERLNNASKNAIQIVNRFAAIEPPVSSTDHDDDDNEDSNSTNDNDKNPWRNPKLIENELSIVRNELNDAWMDLKKKKQQKNNNNNDDDDDDDTLLLSETEFRVLYMDMITDSFGDILDEMNSNKNNNSSDTNSNFDVDILVDCLQSGIDFLDPTTEYNKKSYFDSLLPLPLDNDTTMHVDEENKNDNDNEQLTIHQMKQRSLGYLTC